MALAAVILALSGVSYAQAEQALSLQLPSWFPLLAVAVIIGYGIAALAYMLSTVFKAAEMEAWAKTEVAEMTGSLFLVTIILLALGVADQLFFAATGNTPAGTASGFIDESADKLLDAYIDSIWLSTAVGMLTGTPPQYATQGSGPQEDRATKLSDLNRERKEAGLGAVFPIFFLYPKLFDVNYYGYSVGGVFLGHFGTIQGVALSAVGVALMIGIVLSFILQIAIPVLIPLGMLLGAFTTTRKMGRTLIAFGVGLYLFVPASIIIGNKMFESAYHGSASSPPEIPKPAIVSKFTKDVMAQSVAMTALRTTVVMALLPKKIGLLPYQLMCIPECALIAVPCAIMYPACYVMCFQMCFFVVTPLIIYPNLVTIGEYGANVIMSVDKLTLLGVLDYNEDPIAYIYAAAAGAPVVGGVASFLTQYYLDRALAAKLTDVTLDYTPYILQYSIPMMLIPFIMILVVITAIRSLSPAIGGEVQILGVSELV